MSTFDNTCFNVKIFAQAFKDSKAFYCSKPLSINLSGAREWHKLYCFITIVRIPEILDEYRKAGMNYWRYYTCKNYLFKNFFNYLALIFLKGNDYGRKYIKFKKHILSNLFFPNVYLSPIYYLINKLKKTLTTKKNKILVVCAGDKSKFYVALTILKFLINKNKNKDEYVVVILDKNKKIISFLKSKKINFVTNNYNNFFENIEKNQFDWLLNIWGPKIYKESFLKNLKII